MKIHDNGYIEEYDDGTEWTYVVPKIYIENIKKSADTQDITRTLESLEDLLFEIQSLDVDFVEPMNQKIISLDELANLEDFNEFVEKADSILEDIYQFADDNDVYITPIEMKGENEDDNERDY